MERTPRTDWPYWSSPSQIQQTYVDWEDCPCGSKHGVYYIKYADGGTVHKNDVSGEPSFYTECLGCGALGPEVLTVKGCQWEAISNSWAALVANKKNPPAPEPPQPRSPETLEMTANSVAALDAARRELQSAIERLPALSEAKDHIRRAQKYLRLLADGIDTETLMKGLNQFVSAELAEQRDELEATRENLFDEVAEWKAYYEGMCAEVDRSVEEKAQARVAELEEQRKQAALVVRRGDRRAIRLAPSEHDGSESTNKKKKEV